VQTEINFGYASDAQIETTEKPYSIPSLVDENVNLEMLETIPAYKRRQMSITNQGNESEQAVSKYTLSTDPATNQPRIRDNNAYLNDRVD
jgi:cell division protein FtsZ